MDNINLSEKDWKIKVCKGTWGTHILASTSKRNGYRNWEKFKPSDFPNNLISTDDLERFGIDIVNI